MTEPDQPLDDVEYKEQAAEVLDVLTKLEDEISDYREHLHAYLDGERTLDELEAALDDYEYLDRL